MCISYFKLQNTISVAVASKEKIELTSKQLCSIKTIFEKLPQKFFVQNIDSPFSLSTPYNENKKLLDIENVLNSRFKLLN